jgi:predicted HicB family RNase H-like nuclease
MNSHRSYKGYVGIFRIDDDADVIRGQVVNTRDTITFQGQSVAEAVKAFHESVDDYLDFCKDLGEAPEKPFSGKLLVRIRPEDHRALSTVAQSKGVSINRLVSHALKKVARGAARQLAAAGRAGQLRPVAQAAEKATRARRVPAPEAAEGKRGASQNSTKQRTRDK